MSGGVTPTTTNRLTPTKMATPTNRKRRPFLWRSSALVGGDSRRGWVLTRPAIIAPTRLPKQPDTSQGRPETRDLVSTKNINTKTHSNGRIMATNVGHFAPNPRLPLGATQNWQNPKYRAPTKHEVTISRIEFFPGTSVTAPARNMTKTAITPRTTEKPTLAVEVESFFME